MSLLQAKTILRAVVLRRTYPDMQLTGSRTGQDIGEMAYSKRGRRWNCFFGELAISTAQVMIDNGELFAALKELERFEPFETGHSSREEQGIMYQIALWKAKVHRYFGDFMLAEKQFQKMGKFSSCWPIPGSNSHRAAVYCEMGMFEDAMRCVGQQLTSDACWKYESDRRPARLTVAGIYLMQGLWRIFEAGGTFEDREVQDSLKNSRSMLHELQRDYSGTSKEAVLGRYHIIATLAMIEHIAGNLTSALSYLDATLELAQAGNNSLFAETWCTYAKAEINRRQGIFRRSEELLNRAKELFQRTGRQYHVLGAGSIYFDLVGNLLGSTLRLAPPMIRT